jgi:hypothetical protein
MTSKLTDAEILDLVESLQHALTALGHDMDEKLAKITQRLSVLEHQHKETQP